MSEDVISAEEVKVIIRLQIQELRAEIKRLQMELRAERQDHGAVVAGLQAEIERLATENYQLKGALGYAIPGDIPEGDFKCGLCDAKTIEVNEMHAEIERMRVALMFYSDSTNYKQFVPSGRPFAVSEILIDGGEKARRALEQKP